MTEPPPPSSGSSRLALPAPLIKSLAGFCTSSTQLLQSGKSGTGGQTATTAFAFLQTLAAILNRPASAASAADAAARDAALSAARDIIQHVKARSDQLAAAGSAQEIMLLFELSVACDTPLGGGAQRAAEEALVRLRGDAASSDLLNKVMRERGYGQLVAHHARYLYLVTCTQVLLPLARVGIPSMKAHTLDVCLPKLSELVSSLSPQELTSVIATVARADWVGTSLMRDRLLVAAHRMLTRCECCSLVTPSRLFAAFFDHINEVTPRRCEDAATCQALLQAAGALNTTPTSNTKSTRLTGDLYDAVGSLIIPTPKVKRQNAAQPAPCAKDDV
jgi:hypothetical protein